MTALACGAALTAGAVAIPSADAAQVKAPENGVCQLRLNSTEEEFLNSLNRTENPYVLEQLYLAALGEAFPEVRDLAGEYSERINNDREYRGWFNRNFEAGITEYVDKMAGTGLDRQIARWYFTWIMDDHITAHDNRRDVVQFWENVDAFQKDGTITASNGMQFEDVVVSVPNRAEFLDIMVSEYPDAPKEQLTQWADAWENNEEVRNASRVAQFQSAFRNARLMCSVGGGYLLMPTDGPNPDAARATATFGAPQTEDAAAPATETEQKRVNVRNIDGPRATGTITTTTTSKNVEVDVALTIDQKSDKSFEPVASGNGKKAGSTSDNTGMIIGIIVAVLAVLGIAGGAAFAMMGL